MHSDKICVGDPIFMVCLRYEQEINKRNDAENEFVMLKKVKYAFMIDICFFSVCMCNTVCSKTLLSPVT